MPYYLHQWHYKDPAIHAMVMKPQKREDVVRLAIEAYGGTLHTFFLAFGEFDGVAIAEFDNQITAMACMMSIVGQGGLRALKTTPLLTTEEGMKAMELANEMLDGSGYSPPA